MGNEENRINADPTKEFFITMLTRDIPTDRAILDLIDNSIDASISENIDDPLIEISISEDDFVIKDNSGGLDLDVARNYAFRFGRSSEAPRTPNSVGQFGVGMKRTLFKLGKRFRVESRKNNVAYKIEVDVESWVKFKEWDFHYSIVQDPVIDEGETIITVSDLDDDVKDLFSEDAFINDLMREISEAYFERLSNGVVIEINGKKVENRDILIKSAENLGYIKRSYEYDGVEIVVTCGLSDRSYEDGGWYIICNGRLVSAADQSEVTGWGIYGHPKYHADYAFFRGLVEFSCGDSSKLPFTTTKTGVDKEKKVFKFALDKMYKCMQPVISFLRDRAEESSLFDKDQINDKPLGRAIEEAQYLKIHEVDQCDNFERPGKIIVHKKKPKNVRVSYGVPREKFELVKESLSATTNKQVGEMTFEYYFKYECEDE